MNADIPSNPEPHRAGPDYAFDTVVWKWEGGEWRFATLPFEVTDAIDDAAASARVGFGSVRVEVTIGNSTWKTSLFPDKKAESFVLPVKKPIRIAEGIADGDTVSVTLSVIDE